MREWQKRGRIFEPPGRDWMISHAALPIADRRGDELRIYFSSRDHRGRSQIGYFTADVHADEPVARVTHEPVICFGAAGTFDESGVTSSWIVNRSGRRYHYYTGWSIDRDAPFRLHAGLAIEDEHGVCRKVSNSPLLDRCDVDPHLTASPCVLIENDIWRMWYVSGLGWTSATTKAQPIYHIKYAESRDGIRWSRTGLVCIDFGSPWEHALSRPCVIKDGRRYKMWFAARGVSYRLAYAESDDGLTWERRDDEAGLDVSPAGWDSEMIAYPFVFDDNGRRYMLYNGNGYGRTGIGLAIFG